MGRTELHTDRFKIDQNADLIGDVALQERGGELIEVDRLDDKDYLDELAFNEEPVTIRIEPSTDKNASLFVPIWINGKGAEVFINNRWIEFGQLPVAKVLVVKRKYIELLIRSKMDSVKTEIIERSNQDPENIVQRFTTASHSFSILHDANPMSAAWVEELRRRNAV